MTIRAVLFDLDNTLIDDDDSVRRAIAAACEEAVSLVPGLTVDQLTDAYFRISIAVWTELDLARRTVARGTEVTGAQYRRLCWGQTLGEFGVTEEAVITRVVESYAFWRDKLLPLYPETEEVLAALRPHVKLAIITNGTADTHRRKLARLGYDQSFDYCVVAGEFGPVKPNPAIFLHTAERLGVEPGECMMVGDNAETDVAGAQGAGMTGVWLNRGGWPLPPDLPEPDFVIADLRQLLDLLAFGDNDR